MVKIEKKLHHIHLIAVAILTGYLILSKINYVHALANEHILLTFLQMYVYGAFFGMIFLFMFSHDRFFKFAKDIERTQEKREKRYLAKYQHFGKVISTFLIGSIGGPILGSFSARILLHNHKFKKYIIVALANIPSTFLSLGVGKGAFLFLGGFIN